MLKRLRENPMIAASVLLPLIIVVFFLLATAIPRWLVEPPAYSFLFTVPDHTYSTPQIDVRYDVVDGRLRVRVFKTGVTYRNSPKLYLFDHEQRVTRAISVDLPVNKDSFEDGDELAVSELTSQRVLTARTAPDGYEVFGPGYRNDNLVTALFGGSRHRDFTIAKSGAVFEIPHPGSNRYYYNVTFLGWLVN